MTMRLLPPAAVALTALLASAQLFADSIVRLRVLETTDIHVHLVGYDYYQDQPSDTVGLARTAALIEAARAEVSNSVLVDNGDLLQGNPLGDFIARRRGLEAGEIHPVYKAMNLLDYTVGNIGNHEFNFGLDFLERSIAGANFPYISANVYHDDGDNDTSNDEPYFDQYLIVDRTLVAEDGSKHAIRIGFIGFVPPQIMQWDLSNLDGRVVARDIVETAREVVPRMKSAGADIVVAIPHSGLVATDRHGMDEHASYYLSQITGIDAILFGHSHRVFPGDNYADITGVDLDKGTINGVPATMPGFWGSHLGYVDLRLVVSDAGEWTVVGGIGAVRSIYKRDGQQIVPVVEPVAEILAAVESDHDATIEFMRRGVGETTAPINSFFALVQDDPSIQIVTTAQKHYIEKLIQGTEYDGIPVLSASAPFKSGGRGGVDNFTNIDAGEIALKHIADLYVYSNTLRAVRVTGEEVREWLEMSASIFNQIDPKSDRQQELISSRIPPYNFDVIDGVSYRIDVTQAPRYDRSGALINADSHRIVDLRFGGRPVDTESLFIVATNNYRAGGGGNFPGMDGDNIIIEAPDTNRDVLANYVFEQKLLNPSADHNWSFAAISGDVNVTFATSPKAEKLLTPEMPIERVGIDDDGLGRYRIHFDD